MKLVSRMDFYANNALQCTDDIGEFLTEEKDIPMHKIPKIQVTQLPTSYNFIENKTMIHHS